MGYRTFTDAAGREWEVWDVFPQGARLDAPERRLVDRRAESERGAAELSEGQRDRRRRDRRVSVSPELSRGWLTFRAGDERRRLVPIPPGWDALADAELATLCARARPVRPASGGASGSA